MHYNGYEYFDRFEHNVGSQALPTLLKTIVVKKDAYPNLIVHSPKRPRRTQGELMDATNPPIYQHITIVEKVSHS